MEQLQKFYTGSQCYSVVSQLLNFAKSKNTNSSYYANIYSDYLYLVCSKNYQTSFSPAGHKSTLVSCLEWLAVNENKGKVSSICTYFWNSIEINANVYKWKFGDLQCRICFFSISQEISYAFDQKFKSESDSLKTSSLTLALNIWGPYVKYIFCKRYRYSKI